MKQKNEIGAIGIFDSGIGGLPIARQVHLMLPHEDLIYVADSLHMPYGEKSEDYILQRSVAITEFLLHQNVKAIVVACNTATMVAIKTLRERYDIPFIGVEPGVKPAAIQTQTGVVGVLATEKTLTSQAFDALTKRVAGDVKVEIQPSPKLVHLVENLRLDYAQAQQAVQEYVQQLTAKGADTIILGCTHFAHLAPVIRQVAGDKVSVISTEQAVAKEVKRRILEADIEADLVNQGQVKLYSNGDFQKFAQQMQVLWPSPAQILPW